MPNPVWPIDLPQDVFTEGYDEGLPDVALRTQMDAGPAKTRRRHTAAPRPLNVTVGLSRAQAASFDDFFTEDLAGGALSFDWIHPRTLAAVTLRFVTPPPPRIVPEPGAQRWRVALTLEVMP